MTTSLFASPSIFLMPWAQNFGTLPLSHFIEAFIMGQATTGGKRLRKRAVQVVMAAGLAYGLLPAASIAQHVNYNQPQGLSAGEAQKLEAQRRMVHRHMLAQPQDLQAQFAYAMLSSRLGDLEAATATYEGLLIRQPQAGRVRLELAATYFQLGAQASARAQFRHVLEDPATPAEVKPQIRRFLQALDQKSGGKSGWSGSYSIGAATHSNANGGIDRDTIRIGDWLLGVPAQDRAQGDQRVFGGLELSYRQPFGEKGHAWQADISAGFNSFADLSRMSSQSVSVKLGPDLALPEDVLRKGRLGLTIGYDQVRVGSADYLQAYGAGLALRFAAGQKGQVGVSYDYRREDYQRNATYPSANLYDGDRHAFSVSYLHAIAPEWQVFAQARHEDFDASAAMHSYRETGVKLGLAHRFKAPWGTGAPWAVNILAHASERTNDAANPSLSRVAQHGHEVGLQVIQTVPLSDNTTLQIFGGMRDLRSNYVTRDFRDRYAGFTFSRRF